MPWIDDFQVRSTRTGYIKAIKINNELKVEAGFANFKKVGDGKWNQEKINYGVAENKPISPAMAAMLDDYLVSHSDKVEDLTPKVAK